MRRSFDLGATAVWRGGRGVVAALLCAVLAAASAHAQAVTQTESARGLPIAVVETPGGDLEHLALALPPGGTVATEIAGCTVETMAGSGHRVARLSVPTTRAVAVVAAVGQALAGDGALAVVALGPLPAREMLPLLETWNAAPASPSRPCAVVDGAVHVTRGSPERVELAFAAPGPADLRFDQLPILAAWLQRSLARTLPGVRVDVVLTDGCASLAVRAPAEDVEPRRQMDRLRQALHARMATPAGAEEVAAAVRQLERRRLRWAMDGGSVAGELLQRLLAGGRVAGALVDPVVDPELLLSLARSVVTGHAGFARLVEQERRAVGGSLEPLDNGATVAVQPLAGEAAVVAAALGGGGRPSAELLQRFVERAASRGWYARNVELLGVPAAAVASPPAEAEEVLEALAELLVAGAVAAVADAPAQVLLQELGVAGPLDGAAVAVAVAAPADLDELGEAAAKFLAGLPPPAVTVQTLPLGPALRWRTREERATIVAAMEMPPSSAGVVAGEVMRRRLARDPGATSRWVAAAGRLLLLVEGEADGDVPGLDAALAAAWQEARKAPEEGTVREASQVVQEGLLGDLLQVVARRAAQRFLPLLERPEALAAVQPQEVAAVLAGLPAWHELPRVAHGPAPPPPGPQQGVRESRPRP